MKLLEQLSFASKPCSRTRFPHMLLVTEWVRNDHRGSEDVLHLKQMGYPQIEAMWISVLDKNDDLVRCAGEVYGNEDEDYIRRTFPNDMIRLYKSLSTSIHGDFAAKVATQSSSDAIHIREGIPGTTKQDLRLLACVCEHEVRVRTDVHLD